MNIQLYMNYTFPPISNWLSGKSCFTDSCSKTESLNLRKSMNGLQMVNQLHNIYANQWAFLFWREGVPMVFLERFFKLKTCYIVTVKVKKDLQVGFHIGWGGRKTRLEEMELFNEQLLSVTYCLWIPDLPSLTWFSLFLLKESLLSLFYK